MHPKSLSDLASTIRFVWVPCLRHSQTIMEVLHRPLEIIFCYWGLPNDGQREDLFIWSIHSRHWPLGLSVPVARWQTSQPVRVLGSWKKHVLHDNCSKSWANGQTSSVLGNIRRSVLQISSSRSTTPSTIYHAIPGRRRNGC